jgi:O-antigen ligase
LRGYLSTEVPQIPAQIGQAFVALALGVWAVRRLIERRMTLPLPPLVWPMGLFLVAALLSLWNAADLPIYGLPEFIKWLQIALLLLVTYEQLVEREGRLQGLLAAILLIGIVQAGVGFYQFGLRGDGPDHFAILDGDAYRAYGTFEQPNPYAGFIGLTLSLGLGILAVAVQRWLAARWKGHTLDRSGFPSANQRWLLALAGVAVWSLLAALGMSWSRGAWVGFAAALAAMALALPRKIAWSVVLVVVLGGLVLGMAVTGLIPHSIIERLTGFVRDVHFEDVRGVGINDANYAVIERLAHWQAALSMMRHHLWLGVGLGCYEPAYGEFALINWPFALGHAHNMYLTIAAETGLIGLAAYLGLWAVVFAQTWRATRRASGLRRGIAIGLLGTWTHLSVHHMLDNLLVNNVHLLVGLLLGLLAVIIERPSEETEVAVSTLLPRPSARSMTDSGG